jgi:CRISPR-associated endoribonuclease Cas6
MEGIRYGAFKFSITPSQPVTLPVFKGSTLRGGFGYAFKRVVCALKGKECSDCLLKEKCVYSYIFETPPPSDTKIMRKYPSAPHPFVIEPPLERKRGYKPGDEISFNLILIGRAVDYLPYFIYAFSELGNIGLGKAKGKYELKRVESLEKGAKSETREKIIYSSTTKTLKSFKTEFLPLKFDLSITKGSNSKPLTLNFLTPTRIIYNGHLTLELEFHIFIRNLIRRLSLLYYFHCGGDPSQWDFKGIIEKSKQVKVKQKALRWYDWERYSTRQETKMKMGGFIGKITFEGDIALFMPIIKAGEILHVGKGTGFGLGKYKIQNSKFNV